jgi:hypothetical protein
MLRLTTAFKHAVRKQKSTLRRRARLFFPLYVVALMILHRIDVSKISIKSHESA